ncbi:MAG: MarR family transcriptional regulator [Microcystaceae cyanobacterium]
MRFPFILALINRLNLFGIQEWLASKNASACKQTIFRLGLWLLLGASEGIFGFIGEFGDESGEKKTQGQRVLDLLRKYSPKGLEACEISTYLSIERHTLYTVLDRLEDRQLITKRRSITDNRRWVYALKAMSDRV